MPAARAAGAAEIVGGKLYVVGGVGPDGVVDDVFVFDPDTQEWSTMPGPPIALEHLALVKRAGKLYAVAGRALTLDSVGATVQRFDPVTGTWKRLPSLPHATSGHVAAATRNGFLVSFGGEGPEGVYADAFAYDFHTRRWRTLPALAPARTGFGITAVGSRVFVFGGAGDDPGYYDLTQAIDLRPLRR
jgi:N-acetylneuraminic acid mutarotase